MIKIQLLILYCFFSSTEQISESDIKVEYVRECGTNTLCIILDFYNIKDNEQVTIHGENTFKFSEEWWITGDGKKTYSLGIVSKYGLQRSIHENIYIYITHADGKITTCHYKMLMIGYDGRFSERYVNCGEPKKPDSNNYDVGIKQARWKRISQVSTFICLHDTIRDSNIRLKCYIRNYGKYIGSLPKMIINNKETINMQNRHDGPDHVTYLFTFKVPKSLIIDHSSHIFTVDIQFNDIILHQELLVPPRYVIGETIDPLNNCVIKKASGRNVDILCSLFSNVELEIDGYGSPEYSQNSNGTHFMATVEIDEMVTA